MIKSMVKYGPHFLILFTFYFRVPWFLFSICNKGMEKIQLTYFFHSSSVSHLHKMSSSNAHTLIVKALTDTNSVSAKDLIAAAESARDEETAVALLRLFTYRTDYWLCVLTDECATVETFARIFSIVSEPKFAFPSPHKNDVSTAMLCTDESMFHIIMKSDFVKTEKAALDFVCNIIENDARDTSRIKFLFDHKIADPDYEITLRGRYLSWFEYAIIKNNCMELLEMFLEYEHLSNRLVLNLTVLNVVRSRMSREKQVALIVLVCRQLMNSPSEAIPTFYFTLSILQAAFEQLLPQVDANLMNIACQPVRFGLLLAKSKQLGISIPANASSRQWCEDPDTMDFHEMPEYDLFVKVTIHRTEKELWKSICEK
jgi:hypothetical protein